MKNSKSALLIFLAATGVAWGQRVITVDWQERTLSNAPTKVDEPTPVRLRVTKVNDFLYTYKAKIDYKPLVADQISADDLNRLGILASAPDCSVIDATTLKTKASLDKNFTLKPTDGVFASVPLKQSQTAWEEIEPDFRKLEGATPEEKGCASYKEYVKDQQARLRTLAKIARGNHEFESEHLLPGDGEYTVEVREEYQGKPTDKGTYTAKFYARSSIFSLSVGYLHSQLENRRYDSVDVGTNRKELRVQGAGVWSPAAALLLNYKLPWQPKTWGNNTSLGISLGPVYRMSRSQTGSTAAAAGFFIGMSLAFWENRLLLTPGVHFGEFSDMPLGFDNTRDRTIPAGIANPITGVNRPVTRFGIAFTVQAADFKKAASMATFRQTDAPKPAAPKPDAPKTEASKPDAPKPDAPKPEAPKATPAALATAEAAVLAAKKEHEAAIESQKAAEKLFEDESDAAKKNVLKLAVKQANADVTAAADKLKKAEDQRDALKK